jgi:hypothetical protein
MPSLPRGAFGFRAPGLWLQSGGQGPDLPIRDAFSGGMVRISRAGASNVFHILRDTRKSTFVRLTRRSARRPNTVAGENHPRPCATLQQPVLSE